jgi:hypothetical protein
MRCMKVRSALPCRIGFHQDLALPVICCIASANETLFVNLCIRAPFWQLDPIADIFLIFIYVSMFLFCHQFLYVV